MTSVPEWLTLEPGEAVRWTGQPRTTAVLGTVVRALLRFVAAGVLAWAVVARPVPQVPAYTLPFPAWYLYAGAGLVGLWGAWEVALAYLRVSNVEYVLTTENVYRRRGVLSETVTRVGVDRVQSTRLQKDWTGNLFDYGDVGLSTAGGSGVEMWVSEVYDPGAFQAELRPLIGDGDAGGVGGRGEARGGTGSSAALGDAVAEARRMRETAERIEEVLEG